MEFTTGFDETDKICTVYVTGRYKRPKDSITLQELARCIEKKQGYKRFLFDLTETTIISEVIDTYEAGTVPLDSDQKQLNQGIALIYANKTDDHKYLEKVASRRGYQVKVFNKKDEAVEWLRKNVSI